MEICVSLVGLENSVDRVRGGYQTFATNIAMLTFVRYKFNSCGRNFLKVGLYVHTSS